MNANLTSFRSYCFTLLLAIIALAATSGCLAQEKASAQMQPKADHHDDFCVNWNDGDKNSFSEVREYTVPGSGSLNVDGGKNGGIAIIGEDRSDIFIRACVQTHGKTDEEARAMAKGITIQTSGAIHAEGVSDADWGWGVSYRVYVPRGTNLKLNTYNGGIKISGVNSTMEFTALNGGIKLTNVAGSVNGKTTNGGVKVDLSGSTWSGSGLDVRTTNGGVTVAMPDNYAAHVETGTVNGGFKSDIAGISAPQDRENRYGAPRAVRVSADINGGGAPIRVTTVNGGVKIVSINDKQED
jgi:hypothetical protein